MTAIEMALDLSEMLQYTEKAYNHAIKGIKQEREDIQKAVNRIISFQYNRFFTLIEDELESRNEDQKRVYIERIYNTILGYDCYAFGNKVFLFHNYTKIICDLTFKEVANGKQDEANFFLKMAMDCFTIINRWYEEKVPVENIEVPTKHITPEQGKAIFEAAKDKKYIDGLESDFIAFLAGEDGSLLKWTIIAKNHGISKGALISFLFFLGYPDPKCKLHRPLTIKQIKRHFGLTVDSGDFDNSETNKKNKDLKALIDNAMKNAMK